MTTKEARIEKLVSAYMEASNQNHAFKKSAMKARGKRKEKLNAIRLEWLGQLETLRKQAQDLGVTNTEFEKMVNR